ncbi:uncharacterized protein LOC130636110 [Hydractinia symbiolongicarpus]|uniref:uncharacterized protein LOC130636110 n=1 Tax=Hydractinia symbiolongicarpus TaxID=13093 RepID=UPI0025517EC3|nr:uncharacterized protein LOC130636110 [Hydractinia symbiolongicarpus]
MQFTERILRVFVRSHSTSNTNYTTATPQPDDILIKLEEIKASMKSMVAVECRSEDVEALKRSLQMHRIKAPLVDAFQCLIWNDLATPPINLSSFCREILGCANCILQ